MSSNGQPSDKIIAIDPGRAKCGLILVTHPPFSVVARSVVPTCTIVVAVSNLCHIHPQVSRALIGDGTNGRSLAKILGEALPHLIIELRDEYQTSQRARQRYCEEHPPRGWSRLVPTAFRYPKEAYDDYAAVMIAEDYFDPKNVKGS